MGNDPTSRELMRSILAANLQAASKPSKKDRKAARWLAFLCFVGAFFIAGWLVIDGPPEPKAETAAAEAATEAAPAPPAGNGATGGSGAAGSAEPATEAGAAKTGSTAGEEQGGGGSGETAGSSGEASATLNEEAPWAFAIIALLVGAFLAGAQSLGLGSGAPPKGEPGATGQ